MTKIVLLAAVFFLTLSPGYHCNANEKVASLRDLLVSEVELEETWRQSLERIDLLPKEPLVLLKQPRHQNSVIVLVYDPLKRGERYIDVFVREGYLKDKWKGPDVNWSPSVESWRLVEYGNVTGVFMGKVHVRGPQGTRVKAEYHKSSTRKEDTVIESEITKMFFH